MSPAIPRPDDDRTLIHWQRHAPVDDPVLADHEVALREHRNSSAGTTCSGCIFSLRACISTNMSPIIGSGRRFFVASV